MAISQRAGCCGINFTSTLSLWGVIESYFTNYLAQSDVSSAQLVPHSQNSKPFSDQDAIYCPHHP